MGVVRSLTQWLADTLYAPIATSPKIWTAVVDPTANDDTTPLGVKPGDVWVNTATGNIFDNVDATNGAAVWRMRPRIFASGVAVPLTGTVAETILATVSLPANAVGVNGVLRITDYATYTNSANNKTLSWRLGGIGGTLFKTNIFTTTAGVRDQRQIHNRGAANSQIAFPQGGGSGSGGWASTALAATTGVIDTTSAQTLVCTGTLASAAETIQLESYLVELLRP